MFTKLFHVFYLSVSSVVMIHIFRLIHLIKIWYKKNKSKTKRLFPQLDLTWW